MRAVVEWSYGLPSEDEQLFFRALGTFAVGFAVEAAAAVTMGFFCFSAATTETREASYRVCDGNARQMALIRKACRISDFR